MKKATALAAVIMASSAQRADALSIQPRRNVRGASPVICRYSNNNHDNNQQQRAARPRRAVAHIIASRDEEASRAGYIVRCVEHDKFSHVDNDNDDGVSTNKKRRRPLRVIRRIVLRRGRSTDDNNHDDAAVVSGEKNKLTSSAGLLDDGYDCDELTEEVLVRVLDNHNHNHNSSPFHNSNNRQLFRSSSHSPNRVTFKSTRRAVHSLTSHSMASLTEYMLQPVERYSLLSFHDHHDIGDDADNHDNHLSISDTASASTADIEASTANNTTIQPRRWLVRRLTPAEASRYADGTRSADNLFRLAVPLKPLIGWDLTPVIDLEVLPPPRSDDGVASFDTDSRNDRPMEAVIRGDDENRQQRQWAPLKTIRNRVVHNHRNNHNSNNDNDLPAVKIRSLRVSLLSNRDEVRAAMDCSDENEDVESLENKKRRNHSNNKSKGNGNSKSNGNSYQKDAIEMVTKVEEALRPHITFEAELSWNEQDNDDTNIINGNNGNNNVDDDDDDSKRKNSIVMAKATAVTSLTIPKIPSGILRAAVPSSFLVQRLGSTLTSKALEVCLPRFLRQLERDYVRWSGRG